ncbi:hypothetical protein [Pseudomonas reactans]|uniref:hypothetical protein n=1 Tax=Pseudomonas reactans TaxID=117680 RepID=UPI0015A3CB50|nr:hypothetical protein [Pseudomonas reactans]NWC90014.1 hypothetical protein [Pseudomonas reactans]
MRSREGIRTLSTAADLVACLQEDPLDRVVDYRNDHKLCGPTSQANGCAVVVTSMTALGVTSLNQYVKVTSTVLDAHCVQDFIVAVVVIDDCHARHNGRVPMDIQALFNAAEELTPGRLLSWAGYEALCVLATHPDAEVGEVEWFSDGNTEGRQC